MYLGDGTIVKGVDTGVLDWLLLFMGFVRLARGEAN